MDIIKTSSNGNFIFYKRNGIGMNDTPFESLEIRSEGLAEKHVVEIRLDSDYKPYDGKPIKHTYSDVYISHGMRGHKDTIDDIKEYIEVLNEAIEFVQYIKDFIENSDWKKL